MVKDANMSKNYVAELKSRNDEQKDKIRHLRSRITSMHVDLKSLVQLNEKLVENSENLIHKINEALNMPAQDWHWLQFTAKTQAQSQLEQLSICVESYKKQTRILYNKLQTQLASLNTKMPHTSNTCLKDVLSKITEAMDVNLHDQQKNMQEHKETQVNVCLISVILFIAYISYLFVSAKE